MKATALIAEDEPLLALALQRALAEAWPGLQVLATVGDGLQAVEQALALQPDVLFFDIRMPGQSGLEAAAELADALARPRPAPVPGAGVRDRLRPVRARRTLKRRRWTTWSSRSSATTHGALRATASDHC